MNLATEYDRPCRSVSGDTWKSCCIWQTSQLFRFLKVWFAYRIGYEDFRSMEGTMTEMVRNCYAVTIPFSMANAVSDEALCRSSFFIRLALCFWTVLQLMHR